MKNNTIKIIFISSLLFLVIIALGPMDVFTHGFYSDALNYDMVSTDLQMPISLEDNVYEIQFSPVKKHFAGFELNLANQPKGNTGSLLLTILNERGETVEIVPVDLSKVTENIWYKVPVKKSLKKGNTYTLRFSVSDCNTAPYLQTIPPAYQKKETVTGNVLISYAYAESTFSFQNKVLIILFLVSIWLFICCKLSNRGFLNQIGTPVSVLLFITALLSWNYMYNSMDILNTSFGKFQLDSEALVTGVIDAEHDHVWLKGNEKYGLGTYSRFLSDYTDDNWFHNYSTSKSAILVDSNDYSREYAQMGNHVLFGNGEIFQITGTEDDGVSILISFDSDRILNPYRYGEISKAAYCNETGEIIAPLYYGQLKAYNSQFGLQGKVFRYLTRYMDDEEELDNLHLVCSITTAFVFAIIIFFISIKYNKLFAGVFLYTFGLSRWIVNFAGNLYWVEFTWFIPMAIGLFCSLKVENRKYRIAGYVLSLVSICGKCLCGYEYISVIMMGLIAFLLVDWVKAMSMHDRKKAHLLLRTLVITGIMALVGFIMAISLHALMRGEGNLSDGIKKIFEEDVLRRTSGADMNEFDPEYWPSFNASIWDTFRLYFHFDIDKEVVTGIPGNLFPLLCLVPICILGHDRRMKKTEVELEAMYVVFFFTSVSWFCLAKAHSFIHISLNFVLWYFGFVQICLYIIIHKIVITVKEIPSRKGIEKSG